MIPTSKSLLQQNVAQKVKLQKTKQKAKQKRYYNATAKNLPELKKGDTVRIQPLSPHKKQWERAQVQSEARIRSYRVKTEDGRMYRRNRRHLKLSKEPFITLYLELNLDQPPTPPVKATTEKVNKAQDTSSSTNQNNKRSCNQTEHQHSTRNWKPKRDKCFVN